MIDAERTDSVESETDITAMGLSDRLDPRFEPLEASLKTSSHTQGQVN